MVDHLKSGFVGVKVYRCQVGKVFESQAGLVTQKLADGYQPIRSDVDRELTTKLSCIFNGLRSELPKLFQSKVGFEIGRHDE
jgi:hypothetical protein